MAQAPRLPRIWKVGSLTYSRSGLAALFCWLLGGDFALAVRDRAIPTLMQLLLKKYGASDLMAGLIFASWPSALNLIIGPVVGYQSDRLRTRWGRRIPFFLFTTPPAVLAMAAIAFAPQLGGHFRHFLGPTAADASRTILVVLAILWTIYEISLFTSQAVLNGLINDVVPQEVVGRFFGLFRVVSLIAGIIFFAGFLGVAETHATASFLGVAAINGFGLILMCFKVKEGNYPPPPAATRGLAGAVTAVKTYFREGFGHTYYLWYFAATILGGLTAAPFNLYSVFYSQSVSLSMNGYGKCIGLSFFFSLCLAYPLGWLADRFHPLRTTIVSLVLYAGAMLYGFFFARNASGFGVALVVHTVVAGIYNTSMASLGQRLLPRAKFTEIGSAGGIINSVVWIFFAPVLGTLLDYSHHQYRYTFLAGFVFTVLSLIAFLVLHARFMAYGGPRHYVAPEEEKGYDRPGSLPIPH